ncbi:MAG: hypothetical protein ACRCWM_10525 [Sarcina sp.]
MSQLIISGKKFDEIKKGKVYIEENIKEYLDNKKELKIEELNLVDTPLRAEFILTVNKVESEQKVKEIEEVYNFLIEEEEDKSWRAKLPVNRSFVDLKIALDIDKEIALSEE